MHAIVRDDQDVKAAREQYEQASENRRAYAEKVARAREEFERERQAALDRGEVHSPRLEVIDDEAVSAHLQKREEQAAAVFAADLGRVARRLVPQLEGREQVLLASVPKLKVADLQRVAEEISDLAAAKLHLRELSRWGQHLGMPPIEPTTRPGVTSTQVLDAALSGGSIIGRTPEPPPVPRVVSMDSPEDLDVMAGVHGEKTFS
jgi:hypothetical protein